MLFGGVKQVVTIEGMKCMHCVAHATDALKSIEGVKSVNISLEKKEAVIKSKDGIDPESIKKAIYDVGYTVTDIK